MGVDIQINLGLALLIIGVMVAAVAMYYISYLERKNKPDKPQSVMTRTIVISLIVVGVILTIIYISGEEPKPWHYAGMVVVVLLVFASQYYEGERTKIKRPEDIIEEQFAHLQRAFHAKKDTRTYGHTWPDYKVTEIPGGRIFDVVANSLIRTDQGHFLVQSNPYDKSILSHEFDPDPQKVFEIFGQEIARKYDEERLELLYRLKEAKHDIPQENQAR